METLFDMPRENHVKRALEIKAELKNGDYSSFSEFSDLVESFSNAEAREYAAKRVQRNL